MSTPSHVAPAFRTAVDVAAAAGAAGAISGTGAAAAAAASAAAEAGAAARLEELTARGQAAARSLLLSRSERALAGRRRHGSNR